MKIVFLLSRVPYPLEKGDKLRAFQQLKGLSTNHEVHLVCLNDSALHPKTDSILSKYCKSISIFKLTKFERVFNVISGLLNNLPLQVGYFYSKKIHADVEQKIKDLEPDLVFCQLIRTAEYVKNLSGLKKVIDFQDAFSKGAEQRIQKSNIFLRLIYKYEHQSLLAYEKRVFDYFDDWLIISEQDRESIPHPNNNQIKIIPNGIDTDVYYPKDVEKKYDLLFVGNMQYPPNIDSVRYLVSKILPGVKRLLPNIKVLIAGANPGSSLLKLQSKNIIFSGWVDDISECYADSKLFVAPMRIGTGLQNKLLEAMAMKLPCITTSLVNNALLAEHDKELIVKNEAKDISSYIVELLTNKERAEALAQSGYQFALKNYDMKVVLSKLEQVITNCVERKN
ncbi:MAG: glycosyltransferase [Bacteroidia bacterium]|nr:glycosyltransferase [Bacteroidia bacterium]